MTSSAPRDLTKSAFLPEQIAVMWQSKATFATVEDLDRFKKVWEINRESNIDVEDMG